MIFASRHTHGLMMLSAVALASCAPVPSSPYDIVATGEAPSITSISPSSYLASTNLQTMTIKGSGFPTTATLTFVAPHDGVIQSIASRLIYVSGTQLSYKFNSGADVGDWTVIVNVPNGRSSNPLGFTVQ